MIPVSRPYIDESDVAEVSNAVSSGWVSSLGPYIDKFETQFAEFISVKHCISVSNGTVGLHLALVALGVGPDDEVIIPDITFAACSNAVTYTGAKPILCDINPSNQLISIEDIEKLITAKTKVIMAVHLYGRPVNIEKIKNIIGNRNIYILEDCAEAHAAILDGKRVGGLGDISIFSFYGNKIITTGEGGAVCTNSSTIANNLRILRDHGMSKQKRYWHDRVGFNYRFTNMQAALGVSQLKRIDTILKDRCRIYSKYQSLLGSIPDIKIPIAEDKTTSVCWIFDIYISSITNEGQRDLLINYLKDKGIETRPTFYPISIMPITKSDHNYNPGALSIYFKGLCLPTFYNLSDDDITYICENLHQAIKFIITSP